MRTLTLLAGLCLGTSAWANLPANEPVEPIAPAEITDPAKVELGKQLFFDPRLSRSGFIFLQLLPQPVDGRQRQPAELHRP